MREYLTPIWTDVELVDVTAVLDDRETKIQGWAIKPFAMLASRFEEVILIGADVFFLRKPDELFDDPGYLATGALFFYDRTAPKIWATIPDLIGHMMPFMSTPPAHNAHFPQLQLVRARVWRRCQEHPHPLLGLLATCKMNSRREQQLWSYCAFYGDKETF
ncbi:hypothetical protein BGZ52_007853 [Haplosporangium bisporale]|nr:hypothetical protein BGZ52_007853 [Haplosporangium bisporale]